MFQKRGSEEAGDGTNGALGDFPDRTKGPHRQDPPGPRGEHSPRAASDRKIRLDQYLKLVGFAATGGQAKLLIQAGEVRVNGELETRRGRGLWPGDLVETEGHSWTVSAELWA